MSQPHRIALRRPLVAALSLLLALLIVGACRDGRSQPGAGSQEEPATERTAPPKEGAEAAQAAPPAAKEPAAAPQVVLHAPDGRQVAVTVDVAATPAERQKGLMYRKSMAQDHGMIFLMGRLDAHRFWMKNTYIPLDMIWIGEDFRVVGVTENARPLTLDLRGIDAPSLYVLEVNAHFARRHGITPDWTVELRDVGANVVP